VAEITLFMGSTGYNLDFDQTSNIPDTLLFQCLRKLKLPARNLHELKKYSATILLKI